MPSADLSHDSMARPRRALLREAACLARTLYAAFVFATGTLLFMRPFAWLYFAIGRTTERKRLRYHRWMSRIARTALRLIPGVRLTVRNLAGEDFTRQAVIVCNHQSHLDLLCILSLTPRLVILTNDWVWHNPFYGSIIRHAEFYPVSDGVERNLERLRGLARRGYSVMMFPEGTRSADCRILRFHQGAFRLAAELGLDVLPVFLHGAGLVMPKRGVRLYAGRIFMEIGARQKAPSPDDEGAVRRMRAEMHRYYVEHYAELCRELETGRVKNTE